MKALFLVFHGLEAQGIGKKIRYQINALQQCGVDARLCFLSIDPDGLHKRMINDDVLENFGRGTIAKIKKRICYQSLTDYVLKNKIDFLYIRSFHNANPFLINMLKKLKRSGVISLLEVPTYPYDKEYLNVALSEQVRFSFDKLFRHQLARQIHWIVTFSNYLTIFGVPTINISNGIDFDQIKVKENLNRQPDQVRLIGVAEIHFWHGFDRMLTGLAAYYQRPQKTKVFFDIVGDGVPEEINKLKAIIAANKLEKYVTMAGPRTGPDLDQLFGKADMGVASLGRHRSHITYIKPLKNREYAARGIPFIYSEIDDDFENMPYIMKASPDESPVNVEEIVQFLNKNKFSPADIRDTIKDKLSWKTQMAKVVYTINQAINPNEDLSYGNSTNDF
jgi:hypothetical protein